MYILISTKILFYIKSSYNVPVRNKIIPILKFLKISMKQKLKTLFFVGFRVAWKAHCQGRDLSSYTSNCEDQSWPLNPDFKPGIQAPHLTD